MYSETQVVSIPFVHRKRMQSCDSKSDQPIRAKINSEMGNPIGSLFMEENPKIRIRSTRKKLKLALSTRRHFPKDFFDMPTTTIGVRELPRILNLKTILPHEGSKLISKKICSLNYNHQQRNDSNIRRHMKQKSMIYQGLLNTYDGTITHNMTQPYSKLNISADNSKLLPPLISLGKTPTQLATLNKITKPQMNKYPIINFNYRTIKKFDEFDRANDIEIDLSNVTFGKWF